MLKNEGQYLKMDFLKIILTDKCFTADTLKYQRDRPAHLNLEKAISVLLRMSNLHFLLQM